MFSIAPRRRANWLAIASVVLGLLSFLTTVLRVRVDVANNAFAVTTAENVVATATFVCSIGAAVSGMVSLTRRKQSSERALRTILAVLGLILGSGLTLVFALLFGLAALSNSLGPIGSR
jgi:hypothetical protein